MDIARLPTDPRPTGLRRRLLWVWVAFWLLMFLIGVQDYVWTGGRQLWSPVIDYGTAAVLSTVLAAMQIRRALPLDHLLAHPARWFLKVWAWLPVQLVAYIAAMDGLRFVLYGVAGMPFHGRLQVASLRYEAAKFILFYALLGGIQFGVHSYRAWANERLRAEQQARLAQQAQLAQLTQQLQPHFLFNALNTISSLIHTAPEKADALLTHLASLLRAATDASQRPQQPLADELALLHAYADIMLQRFGDRVRIDWQIDPEAGACKVPTLGLQSLLENCFRHVVEQRRETTHIVVRAARDADTLRVEMEDDGELRALPERRGVGLANLERRLSSLHGADAGLRLRLRPGGGLVVGVELPCVH